MKKQFYYLSLQLLFVGALFFSCSDEDSSSEAQDNTDEETVFQVDKNYIPSTSTLQKTWYGQYNGWDDVQKKNTTIGRTLVINPNGTYTNTIHGRLDSSQDLIVFETEKGTYSYNSSDGILTYTVQYDSLINYQTLQKTGYVKKHYYSANGNNSADKAIYTEKAQFTVIKDGSRQWVAKDTYLQQLTAETLELYFLMENKKDR